MQSLLFNLSTFDPVSYVVFMTFILFLGKASNNKKNMYKFHIHLISFFSHRYFPLKIKLTDELIQIHCQFLQALIQVILEMKIDFNSNSSDISWCFLKFSKELVNSFYLELGSSRQPFTTKCNVCLSRQFTIIIVLLYILYFFPS